MSQYIKRRGCLEGVIKNALQKKESNSENKKKGGHASARPQFSETKFWTTSFQARLLVRLDYKLTFLDHRRKSFPTRQPAHSKTDQTLILREAVSREVVIMKKIQYREHWEVNGKRRVESKSYVYGTSPQVKRSSKFKLVFQKMSVDVPFRQTRTISRNAVQCGGEEGVLRGCPFTTQQRQGGQVKTNSTTFQLREVNGRQRSKYFILAQAIQFNF